MMGGGEENNEHLAYHDTILSAIVSPVPTCTVRYFVQCAVSCPPKLVEVEDGDTE